MEDTNTIGTTAEELPHDASPAASEASDNQLDINDIANSLKIIDYSLTKNIFKDWDTIEQVLPYRKRLKAFVDFAAGPQDTEAVAPQLELNDIVSVLNIIDFAQKEGAFNDFDTLEQVMPVRKRLKVFVDFASQTQQVA